MAVLSTNLVVKQLYTDVQLLNSLFQKAYGKVVYRVQLLKMLNVSERPRTGVVPSSSDVFAAKARRSGMCKNAHSPNNDIRAKKSKQLLAVLSREETAKIFSLLPRND